MHSNILSVVSPYVPYSFNSESIEIIDVIIRRVICWRRQEGMFQILEQTMGE